VALVSENGLERAINSCIGAGQNQAILAAQLAC
jgi:uncharacterized protein YidB (DUF937 family)